MFCLFASATFQNSMTALIVAVKGGYTDVVKELLKRNPNVNMTDKDGNTALAIAAKEGHVEIVQDLLDAGSYVNIPDRVRPAWCYRAGYLFGKAAVLQNTSGSSFILFSWCVVFLMLSEWGNNVDRSSERRSCGDSSSSAEQIR